MGIAKKKDIFQEVKSKRETRKEMKETRELKTQQKKNSDTSSAVKVGEEHNDEVASSESHTNSNDYAKSVDMRDNVIAGSATSSTLVHCVKTSKQQPAPHSDPLNNDGSSQNSENRDSVSLSRKPPAATLVTWNRGISYSGHMTMADIVRTSKPPSSHSQTAAETTYAHQDSNSQFPSFNHLKPSHDSSHSQMGMQKDQQGSESPLPSGGQQALDVGAAEGYSENLPCKLIPNYLQLDDVSHLRELNNTASLNDKVSSNAVDFQKLILEKEELRTRVSEDTSAVVLPNYVQDIATDLSHMSFGTYNSGVSTAVLESLTSDSLKNDLKEGLNAFADPFDPRNSWFTDQILRCKKLGLDKESRDNVLPPQSESRRPHIPQVPNAYEYTSSSIPDSSYWNNMNPVFINGLSPLHRELALNSSAFPLPISYSLPLPGVSLAMGSGLPRSALQHSYQDTGAFHDSLAHSKASVPQFGAGAFRNSWPPSASNDILDGNLGTPTNLARQFHHDIHSACSAVGYFGGFQSQSNEDSLAVLQQARNSQLFSWDYGSSMRSVPNVLDGRNHIVHAQNQLLFGYPQTQQLLRNYEALGRSNVYHSQAGTIQDQQLGLGGLPFTQEQLSRPSDQFWQQGYQR